MHHQTTEKNEVSHDITIYDYWGLFQKGMRNANHLFCFIRNKHVEIIDKEINSISESWQIIFHNIPNQIGIDVEIAMGNMVSHTFYCFPWNLRTMG